MFIFLPCATNNHIVVYSHDSDTFVTFSLNSPAFWIFRQQDMMSVYARHNFYRDLGMYIFLQQHAWKSS